MKRKGFTLVELLIVIVVIGILSAMMMLSSTEAVTSAKASNVVSNLRNLKTAALALYVDELDDFETKDVDASGNKLTIANVIKYLNSAQSVDMTGGYTYDIKALSPTGATAKISDAEWYLSCNITDPRVQEKLEGRAKSTGLLAEGTTAGLTASYKKSTSGANKVYYRVR